MRVDMSQTSAIHAGHPQENNWGQSTVPIFQTASFACPTAQELADTFTGKKAGFAYTRSSNPTTAALERRLTELEQGVGCIAMASGMGAVSAVLLGLLRTGDQVVASAGLFGGTLTLLTRTLDRFGVVTRFVDVTDTDEVVRAVTPQTRLVLLETIGNPKMDVPDLQAIADAAHRVSAPLVLDATVTTPALMRARDFGADLVIHSTTKFINGHGTAVGGALIDTGLYDWAAGPFTQIHPFGTAQGKLAFLAYLRSVTYRDLGAAAAPMNSFLMLQGLETLPLRMARHCDHALALARFLRDHQHVDWVHYPGLPDDPFYQRADRQFGGRFGALLTFGLGTRQRSFRFINALRLAMNQTNIGDAKTLVIHPASTIYHDFTPEQKAAAGVGEDLIRVSVGLEEIDDLQNDFAQALEKVVRDT